MQNKETASYFTQPDMKSTVTANIRELQNDRVHGAGYLSELALHILMQAMADSKAENVKALNKEIEQIADKIVKARPGMISVVNNTLKFAEVAESVFNNYHDLEQAKKQMLIQLNRLDNLSREMTLNTAQNGSQLIQNKYLIITCSYSSLVCKTLVLAKNKGKSFTTTIARSTSHGISYGEMTARELKQNGIIAEVIRDEEIVKNIQRANIVITGADTVTEHFYINGTPSGMLAEEAAKAHKKLYVLCESSKFDMYKLRTGNEILEKGFDRIPLNLVTGILTEKMTISPAETGRFIDSLKYLD